MPRSKDGRWDRACVACGNVFSAREDAHVACSVACRQKLPCTNEGGLRVKGGLEPKPCTECGTLFQPIRQKQQWCSQECRHEAGREDRNASRRLTPLPDARACEECGTPFTSARGAQVFCSKKCRSIHGNAKRDAQRKPASALMRRCEACGAEFRTLQQGQRWCCGECRLSKDRPAAGQRACAHCGAAFESTRSTQAYCSASCRLKAYKARNPQHRTESVQASVLATPLPARACEWCGERFTPLQQNSTCCSKPCRIRAENLRSNYRKYGLTVEDVEAKLAAQGGVCAICGEPPKPGGKGPESRLHVDHDHATGQLRDMLCGNCNKMLGLAKEKLEVLLAAAEYLERHALAAGRR